MALLSMLLSNVVNYSIAARAASSQARTINGNANASKTRRNESPKPAPLRDAATMPSDISHTDQALKNSRVDAILWSNGLIRAGIHSQVQRRETLKRKASWVAQQQY